MHFLERDNFESRNNKPTFFLNIQFIKSRTNFESRNNKPTFFFKYPIYKRLNQF